MLWLGDRQQYKFDIKLSLIRPDHDPAHVQRLSGRQKLSVMATGLLCLLLVLVYAEKKREKEMTIDQVVAVIKRKVQAVYTSHLKNHCLFSYATLHILHSKTS